MAEEFRFEWDPRKAAANLRKHGVSFETAAVVFDDPLTEKQLQGDEHGEVRWKAIGEAGGAIYYVVYTTREEDEEEVIRIISARKATRSERRAYQRDPEDHG